MEFENLTVKELRAGVRHFDPEQRKSGSIACTGNKEQLIEFLREKGIMPSEVKEYCDGNQKIKAPKDNDADIFGNDAAEKAVIEYTKAGDAGAGDDDFSDLYEFDADDAKNAGQNVARPAVYAGVPANAKSKCPPWVFTDGRWNDARKRRDVSNVLK